jgi:FtsZ-binding cell division protein ZapB
MDRMQFVDQIAALDLQISELRERMMPMRKNGVEGDRTERDYLQQQLRRLVDRKAELRTAFANS